jgi:hypothetical protein
MGGHRQPSKRHKVNIESSLRQAILDAERVLKDDELTSHALPGDDIQLQYHELCLPIYGRFVQKRSSAPYQAGMPGARLTGAKGKLSQH